VGDLWDLTTMTPSVYRRRCCRSTCRSTRIGVPVELCTSPLFFFLLFTLQCCFSLLCVVLELLFRPSSTNVKVPLARALFSLLSSLFPLSLLSFPISLLLFFVERARNSWAKLDFYALRNIRLSVMTHGS